MDAETKLQVVKVMVAEYNVAGKFQGYQLAEWPTERWEAVNEYLKSYTGDFPFMLSVKKDVEAGRWPSANAMAGVANCLVADVKKRMQARTDAVGNVWAVDTAGGVVGNNGTVSLMRLNLGTTAEEPALQTVEGIRSGFYTAVLGDGTHVTLKISDWKSEQGTQIVATLVGPDNTSSYESWAFLRGGALFPWKHYKEGHERWKGAVMVVLGAPEVAGKTYALASGRCYICGRLLTTPESILAGIGPVCARKG